MSELSRSRSAQEKGSNIGPVHRDAVDRDGSILLRAPCGDSHHLCAVVYAAYAGLPDKGGLL